MEHERQDYIAVFDSGVGGLSVLRHLLRLMPNERYIYYGDCANAPYGTRPTGEARALTMAAIERLLEQYRIKALVVACNTATAVAIEQLRARYPHLIVIGIEPALKLAADRHPGGQIGVMATRVTLHEEKFRALWDRFAAQCSVYPIEAPGLVELVECGQENSPQAEALLRQVLGPYVGQLDALVLGCTHFPFAADAIRRVLGSTTELLDGGDGTARETRRRLEAAQLRAHDQQLGQLLLESSGDREQFHTMAQKLLNG